MSIKRKYIAVDAQSKESTQEVRLMNKENIICGKQMMLKNPDTQELEDIRDIFMHKDGIIHEIAEIVKQMIGNELSGIEKIDLESEYTLADVAAKVNEILDALKGRSSEDEGGADGQSEDVDPSETRATYTPESGLQPWTGNISGTLEYGTIPNMSDIQTVDIGNTVAEIYNDAFDGCDKLSAVTIPSSVTSISGYAFSNCTSLSSIVIPSSVETFSATAFEQSHFVTVTFDGRTMAQTQAISDFPIGMAAGVNVICSDGTFTIQ